jgi:hypothetical protein
MTLNAQRDTILGAVVSDEVFRESLFECKDVEKMAETLHDYAVKNGLEDFYKDVTLDAWKFTHENLLPDLKYCITLFCRHWPCRLKPTA